MEITTGKMKRAERVVVYGPEGIGKSTFASKFPDPLFIDTEGSTSDMDVKRLPQPTSWAMFVEEIMWVKQHPESCRTLVIDTADWAEKLCKEMICGKYSKNSIEDFGYGKGYVMLAEEFGRFLNALTDLTELGIHVILTAHAQMRKFEEPNETGAYDRWELKLEKKTAPIVKEWSTMLLFANYKILVVQDENKKAKARGGQRVLYTQHHACWDAKNRKGWPEELPFDYSVIAADISETQASAKPAELETPSAETHQTEQSQPEPESEQAAPKTEHTAPKPEQATQQTSDQPKNASAETRYSLLRQLDDLMAQANVNAQMVRAAVAKQGYYPVDTPISSYDDEFIKGCLIAAWPQVLGVIQKLNDEDIPF